jgi:hypothetical protein
MKYKTKYLIRDNDNGEELFYDELLKAIKAYRRIRSTVGDVELLILKLNKRDDTTVESRTLIESYSDSGDDGDEGAF